jgi:hypothetical protein
LHRGVKYTVSSDRFPLEFCLLAQRATKEKFKKGNRRVRPQSKYRGRREMVACILPLSWSVHYKFSHDGRLSERG